MNVNDLINELQKMIDKFNCGDAIVVIDGYEGGLKKLENIKEIQVIKYREIEEGSLFGEYTLADANSQTDETINAVYLPRR